MVVSMYSDLFDPVIATPDITVETVEGEFGLIKVSWDAQSGATGYHVYGAYSPLYKSNKLTKYSPVTNTYYEIRVPVNVSDVQPYFWVTKIVSGQETYLNDLGVSVKEKDTFADWPLGDDTKDLYIYDDEQMKYYAEEMRRRAIAILENNGEEFDLYLRMWYGNPCTCTSEGVGLDPNYQGMTNHELCFGTGIIGGYYPKITIKAIYITSMSSIEFRDIGLMPNVRADFMTLWAPKIRRQDILVRKLTGERYLLTEVNPRETFRGLTMEQLASWQLVEPTNIVYKLTNEKLQENYNLISAWDIARFGWDRYDWNIFF